MAKTQNARKLVVYVNQKIFDRDNISFYVVRNDLFPTQQYEFEIQTNFFRIFSD